MIGFINPSIFIKLNKCSIDMQYIYIYIHIHYVLTDLVNIEI